MQVWGRLFIFSPATSTGSSEPGRAQRLRLWLTDWLTEWPAHRLTDFTLTAQLGLWGSHSIFPPESENPGAVVAAIKQFLPPFPPYIHKFMNTIIRSKKNPRNQLWNGMDRLPSSLRSPPSAQPECSHVCSLVCIPLGLQLAHSAFQPALSGF